MLSGAQLHLLTNHIPIVGIPFILALLGYGLLRNSDEVLRLSMYALVVVGFLSVPAFLSGEKAEHMIENQTGVSEVYLEAHEEAAEVAFWFLEALAVLTLIGLMLLRGPKPIPRWMGVAVLVGLLISGALMVRVGHLGGKINHPEIRSGQTETPPDEEFYENDDD